MSGLPEALDTPVKVTDRGVAIELGIAEVRVRLKLDFFKVRDRPDQVYLSIT